MDHSAVARAGTRQLGLVTVEDLRKAGASTRLVVRWVQAGRLERVEHGVLRIAGAPATPEAAVLAAILVHGPHTWASHRTGAWVWGTEGFGPPGRIELLRDRPQSNTRSAAVVHRTNLLLPEHVTMRRSIPVTTLPRTLFDLASVLGPQQLERAIEAALRTRHCTIGGLCVVLATCGRRGRAGTVAFRTAVQERGIGYVPTESELDRLGRAVLAEVEGLEWQVEVSDHQGYLRRVDGMHRRARVIIEWDGATFHDGIAQRRLDREHDARLRRLGYAVLRFRWADVVDRPLEVIAAVVDLIAERS